MTSEATQQQTIEFFAANDYFGLSQHSVLFFKQFTMPCIGLDGRILMFDKHLIQLAPDGNGGLYRALRERGILSDMKSRGINYVQIFGIDNILTKVADPDFIGFCIDKQVEMAAKIVEKQRPDERVGVVTWDSGSSCYRVVEYSEINPHDAGRPDPNFGDKLLLRAGSICQHFVTVPALQAACRPQNEQQHLPYHAARKKIPHLDLSSGEQQLQPAIENGIKLERFVFDIFPLAGARFAVWEVAREEEFSPLKNSPSSATDCPSTCRSDLLRLHASWLSMAGLGQFRQAEVSPLVSYHGELLHQLDLHAAIADGSVHVLQ